MKEGYFSYINSCFHLALGTQVRKIIITPYVARFSYNNDVSDLAGKAGKMETVFSYRRRHTLLTLVCLGLVYSAQSFRFSYFLSYVLVTCFKFCEFHELEKQWTCIHIICFNVLFFVLEWYTIIYNRHASINITYKHFTGNTFHLSWKKCLSTLQLSVSTIFSSIKGGRGEGSWSILRRHQKC